jgi:hypothetical protein
MRWGGRWSPSPARPFSCRIELSRALRRGRDLRCAVIFKTVRVQAARLLALEVSSAISDKTLIVYAASSIRTMRRPLGCRPSG